jgi:hypothetical protein
VTKALADAAAAAKAESSAIDNKNRPENQHGKKASPKKTAASVEMSEAHHLGIDEYSSSLIREFKKFKQDVLSSVESIRQDQVMYSSTLAKESMKKVCDSRIKISLIRGIAAAKRDCKVSRQPSFSQSAAIRRLQFTAHNDLERFFDALERSILKSLAEEDLTKRKLLINSSFSCIEYRLDFMGKNHPIRSYNYGYALTALGYDRDTLEVVTNENACDNCVENASEIIVMQETKDIYNNLPPWHANCLCLVKIRGDKDK